MEKCQFCGFLKAMFSLFRKACLIYKTSKMVFSQFIFAIYDLRIQWVKRGYWGYKGFQGVSRGYKELQGVTRGYKGLKGVTRG